RAFRKQNQPAESHGRSGSGGLVGVTIPMENIQHLTFNFERPGGSRSGTPLNVGRSMLNVECSEGAGGRMSMALFLMPNGNRRNCYYETKTHENHRQAAPGKNNHQIARRIQNDQ